MSTSDADRPTSPAGRAVAETAGLAVWLIAAAGWVIWLARQDWTFGTIEIVTAAGLILALAVLARRGWVLIFGPVLVYEGMRSARRLRFFVLRWVYAIGLLLLLLYIHFIWSLEYRYAAANTKALDEYKMQSKFAEQYFYAFAVIQFAAVVLLTPAYVAGGIAEEKERKTLDFLLATDLRGREIVFGKLLARLGNLALFVLTGLPVLSLMQFFGGIDPGLLLGSFAVTALTALSLAGLGTLLSVQRRRARDAIVLTYLAAVGYVAIASLCLAIPPLYITWYHEWRGESGVPGGMMSVMPPYYSEVQETVEWFNAGNPFYGLGGIIKAIDTNSSVVDVLSETVERYATFHVPFAFLCIGLAVWRLRPIALAQSGESAKKKKRRFQLVRIRRPKMGQLPMVWKEMWVEGGLKFGWLGRIFVGLVVGISFVPLIIIVYIAVVEGRSYRDPAEGINGWVRSINAIVSTLMLLGVAVRAAGSVGGERDRDTLTSLMTTPLTAGEIVWAKLVGSLASVRIFLIWLGLVWFIGIVTGAVSIFALPLNAIAWFCPATAIAAYGLFCSANCKTSLRATTWALLGTLFMLGGHWVCMGFGCFTPLALSGVSERSFEWLLEIEAGLSPPFMFGVIPFREVTEIIPRNSEFPALTVVAQVFWLIFAAVVGRLAHDRFRWLTNRVDRVRPPRRPPPPPVVVAVEEV
jgi:ABC-type transport system involved in multi-copper enzyme maturation permease subunit